MAESMDLTMQMSFAWRHYCSDSKIVDLNVKFTYVFLIYACRSDKICYTMLYTNTVASISENIIEQLFGRMTVITEGKKYHKAHELALCKSKTVFWNNDNFCPVLSGIQHLSNITTANNCPSTQTCCYVVSLMVAMETLSVEIDLNCCFVCL